jgi:hypothetical protein
MDDASVDQFFNQYYTEFLGSSFNSLLGPMPVTLRAFPSVTVAYGRSCSF